MSINVRDISYWTVTVRKKIGVGSLYIIINLNGDDTGRVPGGRKRLPAVPRSQDRLEKWRTV